MSKKDEMKELEKDLKIALALKSSLTVRKNRLRAKLMYLMEEGTEEPDIREDSDYLDEFSKLLDESQWTKSRLDIANKAIEEIHRRMDKLLTD